MRKIEHLLLLKIVGLNRYDNPQSQVVEKVEQEHNYPEPAAPENDFPIDVRPSEGQISFVFLAQRPKLLLLPSKILLCQGLVITGSNLSDTEQAIPAFIGESSDKSQECTNIEN
jgi:hypothetical protein